MLRYTYAKQIRTLQVIRRYTARSRNARTTRAKRERNETQAIAYTSHLYDPLSGDKGGFLGENQMVEGIMVAMWAMPVMRPRAGDDAR
eukprot:4575515-Pyramimonas_sp.AAC.1